MAIIEFPRRSDRSSWVRAYNELRQWHFHHKWDLSVHERQAMLRSLLIEIDLCEAPEQPSLLEKASARVRKIIGWTS